jgi:hypothetical protein
MVINNGANGGSGSNSAFEGLMAMLLSDKLGIHLESKPETQGIMPDEIKKMRDSILSKITTQAPDVPVTASKNGGD